MTVSNYDLHSIRSERKFRKKIN